MTRTKHESKRVRSRGWCFTINNWTDEDLVVLERLDYVYLVAGRERGENGTPHLQGYIHYKIPKSFATVKRDLPKAHIESRKGTPKQAAEYCRKDGDFVEFGVLPETAGDASKIAWTTILDKAKCGDTKWIEENYPKVWIQSSHRLQSLRCTEAPVLDGPLEHEWWIGETGTGKSKTLWELYPKHFQKELNKWWDGYDAAAVVAIEEWSPKNECTGSLLKIWADRYPFTGQIKGGALQKIRPKKLIVLSNYSPEDCFPDPRDHLPLLRRFRVLRFPRDRGVAVDRALAFQINQEVPGDDTVDLQRGGTSPFLFPDLPDLSDLLPLEMSDALGL